MSGHAAQPQADTRELILEALRCTLKSGDVGARVLSLQAALGHRFNFELLGEILLRATNEELVALHRPSPSRPKR